MSQTAAPPPKSASMEQLVASAMTNLEAELTPDIAARLATASMRVALSCFAYIQVKSGAADGRASAAMLLHLADHLAPVGMAA